MANGPLPQFGYQIQLASGEVEKVVNDETSIRQFLKAVYGARTPNGELAFDPYKGLIFEKLPYVGESKILNGKVSVMAVISFLFQQNSMHCTSSRRTSTIVVMAQLGHKAFQRRSDQIALSPIH